MRKVIWSNFDPINLNEWEDFLESYPEIHSKEDQYRLCEECRNEYLGDERRNLDIDLPERIIVIGNLGFWSGPRFGYKEIGDNLRACLFFEKDCDYAKWFVDGHGNLCSQQSHHDGMHNLVYRMWKPGLSERQKDNFKEAIYYGMHNAGMISRYTKSLGPYVCKVYGW